MKIFNNLSSMLLAAVVFASPVFAQSDDAAADALIKSPARSERLDIYGVGMCHTCEWRPRATVKPAGEQCGTAADGTINVGIYECGRNPQCEPTCNFVRCGTL